MSTNAKKFTFDVKMFAAISVTASSSIEARAMIRNSVDGADANFGAWPDGDPILSTVAIDGTLDLIEVDGEETP